MPVRGGEQSSAFCVIFAGWLSSLALLLELRAFLVLILQPLAEFFKDRLADLDQAKLDSIQVLVKPELEDFVDRDVAKIRQKLTGKSLRLNVVLKISAIDSRDLVERMINGINAEEDRSRERLVLDQEFNNLPGHHLAPIMFSIGFQRAA